ncbi:MAG: DUF1178 family protein [Devosia sp.]
MIQYALVCENAHKFDAWFSNAEAYDEQHGRGIVACPVCNSTSVEKALMTPAVSKAGTREKVSFSAGHPQQAELRRILKALRDKVVSEADYVGDRFAEEARKIHFNDAEARGIYGEATPDEVTSLIEDGVEFMPLPTLPEDHN